MTTSQPSALNSVRFCQPPGFPPCSAAAGVQRRVWRDGDERHPIWAEVPAASAQLSPRAQPSSCPTSVMQGANSRALWRSQQQGSCCSPQGGQGQNLYSGITKEGEQEQFEKLVSHANVSKHTCLQSKWWSAFLPSSITVLASVTRSQFPPARLLWNANRSFLLVFTWVKFYAYNVTCYEVFLTFFLKERLSQTQKSTLFLTLF